jgi:perosamine synthetase
MKGLAEVSKKYGIPIIEDAAEALGSRFHGKHAGTIGEIGVFSFHGSKTITTGEGGMLVTNSQEVANRLSQLNNHGRSPNEARQFFPAEIGYKFKMSNLQAAIGLAQLERFDELISRKQQILNSYRDALSNYPEISINPIQNNCVSGSWMPNVVFSESTGVTREKLVAIFRQANIDARVFFWPVSSLGLVKSRKTHTPIAYSIASRSINLPSYHDIGDDDVARVVELLLTAFN